MNAYFKDMEVVDERLTALENEVDNIMKLLVDIQRILEVTVEKKVSSSTRTPNRTSRRTKS